MQMFEKNWQELIRPSKLEIEKKEDGYVKFSTEPFERGYGITIGNSLRRILLSSIMGGAITSVWIDGVDHDGRPVCRIKHVLQRLLHRRRPSLIFALTAVKLELKLFRDQNDALSAGQILHSLDYILD